MSQASSRPRRKTREPKPRERQSVGKAAARRRPTVWLQEHGDCARDSLLRLLATPLGSLMTVFVVAIALLLPALLQRLNANLAAVDAGYLNAGQITLYLQDALTEAEGREVSNDLLSMEAISSATYVSQSQALADFASYSGLGDLLTELPENPLPASILVIPVDDSAEANRELLAELQALPQVRLAQSDLEWLQRLEALRAVLQRLNLVFSTILALAVVFIMGNTIRLAIENRREEIAVVKLVGGSNAFAARPFLYTGLWLGLAGGLLAALLLGLVLLSFRGPLQSLLGLYDSSFALQGPGVPGLLLLPVVGAVLGWLGALLSTLQQLQRLDAV